MGAENLNAIQEVSTQLTIPEPIQSALVKHEIAFTLVHTDKNLPLNSTDSEYKAFLPEDEIVMLSVLQDSLGKLQILMFRDCLLDLSRLCELFGRNLQAIPAAEYEDLLRKQGLESNHTLAAVPFLQNFELLADQALTNATRLYLESGYAGLYFKIELSEIKKLIWHARVGAFTQPCAPLLEALKRESGELPISRAVEQFTTLRIRQRLSKTVEIPPLPDTAERIISLRVDPNSSVAALSKVVETDPSLAAQVVSWAASPYYGAGNIASVHDAVNRVLGFDLVANLALGLALGKSLRMPADGPRGITPYWHQAIYCASLMEALVARMQCDDRPGKGLAYLSGLLHNFGYLVLGYIFPPHFSLISRYIEVNRHVGHHVIEQHVLGVSREQISAWLMGVWQMPEEIIAALRWQQFGDYAGRYARHANLLYVANQTLRANGIGSGPVEKVKPSLYEFLGLSPEKVQEAVAHVLSKSDDLKNIARNLAG